MIRPSGVRLGSTDSTGPQVLVLGNAALLGASSDGLRAGGLPDRIAASAHDALGNRVGVDVLWDLGTMTHALTGLLGARRLPRYDAIVAVIKPVHVLAAPRRLAHDLAMAWPLDATAPRVVVVLADHSQRDTVSGAEGRIHDLTAGLPRESTPTVLRVGLSSNGGIHDSNLAAAAVIQALDLADRTTLHPAAVANAQIREVEVDRAVRTLVGRTSHLRRALTMAQHSFDVPYAQLNLVSRGTLRSLAYIGRSSDGLEQSLSAEAVHLPGPLLIGDTHTDDRFASIPETRGVAAIRYYVGHPIRSDSGHAIGVLCVLDTQPHDIEPDDDILIRDLALLAEGELAAATNDT